jgi:hypothetical protein
MMKNNESKRAFRNALSNYQGVLDLHGSDIEKRLIKADQGLNFPEHPKDIIEYLGNIEPLKMNDSQKNEARQTLQNLIGESGTETVWDCKLRYKLELYYINEVF